MKDLVNCIKNTDKVMKLSIFVEGLLENGNWLNIGAERRKSS